MPSWVQPCGEPLQSVIINARMRVPTKRMDNIGQNITTPLQFSMVCVSSAHSKPVNSLTVMAAQIQMYTKKNWKVRLITHCIVGEMGMVYSGPFGCWIVKMLYTTQPAPTYRQIIITYRPTASSVPNALFSTVYSMSPSTFPVLTSPCKTNGTATEKHVCARSAYVHMKKQFCAHFCGFPLIGSIFNARMRAAMNSTASIGAKFMLAVAVSKALSTLLVKFGAMPVNWVQLRAICIPP